ncbi:MAG: hypothetical protein JWM28_4145, partial [Chitinophagaceae bacterium]|nr:hypothetical protein [Chitinophagaceae bacterium]
STATFYNLVFNNTANNGAGDIILNGIDAAVSNSCTFTDGIVNSVTSNKLIFNNNATAVGAGNASFVNVKVVKTGNNAFTFPVGKSNVGYMPCAISAPSNTTDAFTAEYRRNSATALGPITAAGLYHISACEYWMLDRTTGSSNVNVTLSWSGISPCNAAAYVTSLSSLVVTHFNGTDWNAYGNNGGFTGNGAAGTVTWNNVSSFSPFTLGSTSAITNPLPVKLSAIKAFRVNTGDRIDWTNLTEKDLQRYEVERSGNGTSFNTIYSVFPKANDGQEQYYTMIDEHLLNGTNFYRIKALQLDGSYSYSAIVKIEPTGGHGNYISVYPNPVAASQFTMQFNNYTKGSYVVKLSSSNGQQIMNKIIQHPGGSMSVTMERPAATPSGLYILQVTGDQVNENRKLMIK